MSRASKIVSAVLVTGGILAATGGFAWYLVNSKPEVAPVPQPRKIPQVEYVTVQPEDWQLWVDTQGNVTARTETSLTSEVAGRILRISPSFKPGGFFEAGDVLLEIDPLDYEAALANARAQLAQARLALAQEVAQAEQAQQDWSDLGQGDTPTELVLREPQQAMARANVAAAEARVKQAERDLERTKVRAPYAGRIRDKMVDIGQNVSGSTTLASIYAVDVAEVRFPLSPFELSYLDLPEAYRDDENSEAAPRVKLTQTLGNETYSWDGYLDRTEGTVDMRSRLTYAVARVPDPYGSPGGDQPPLKIGSFVQAHIAGRYLQGIYVVPRKALIDQDTLYVIEPENALTARDVSVYWSDSERAIISGGLQPGERVCLTPIIYFLEGMPVQPLTPDPLAEAESPVDGPKPEASTAKSEPAAEKRGDA
ncbi:MAG: efflux RND transporter periplasmic adaptor subunit [Verrucomicrobiota bacterium JB022]|nr:efflux RND transporter periplasmic adaptor subunit [Verrucomicrobiota bacterium JB022]